MADRGQSLLSVTIILVPTALNDTFMDGINGITIPEQILFIDHSDSKTVAYMTNRYMYPFVKRTLFIPCFAVIDL